MPSKLFGFFQLMRPLNTLLFWVSVWIGGWLSAGSSLGEVWPLYMVAAFSAMLIGAGSNAINDYFDLEIDRINRPNRPLPSGRILPKEAWLAWVMTSGLGILLSLFLSLQHVCIALTSVLFLYVYSWKLKGTPLLGNLMVALLGMLGIWYGALVKGEAMAANIAMAFAFMLLFLRELVKDMEDVEGDRAENAQTFPVRFGLAKSLRLAGILAFLSVVAIPLPYLWYEYPSGYLTLVLGAAWLMLRAIWLLYQAENPIHGAKRASKLLKAAMIVGMLALATKPL